MPERLKSHRRAILALVLGVTATTLALGELGWLQRLEWQSYDWRMQQSRGHAEADPRIAVILIDDASLKALDPVVGRWPWPRSIYAELLDFLALGQPRAVLFDITFSERQGRDDQALADDQALVQATADYPFVYHAARLLLDHPDEANSALLNRPLPAEFAARFSVNQRLLNISGSLPGFAPLDNNAYYLPFDGLWQASPGLGIVDVDADADGVYRRARLLHRYQGLHFPALSTTALLDQSQPTTIQRRDGHVLFDQLAIPVDGEEKYAINFYRHFALYSFSGLLASLQQIRRGELDRLLVDPYEFEDKLVFIGASAAGLQDLKTTPLDGRLPGVLLHASIASNILQGDFLTPLGRLWQVALVAGLGLVCVLGIFALGNLLGQTLLPILLAAGTVYGALWAFGQGVVVELVPPLLAIVLAWFGSASTLLLTEGMEKRRFKRMMAQYLSPAVLNTVVARHQEFAQAEIGTQEEISILFSDIRGFTQLSENLPPQQVVEILNHYFSHMTEVIFRHQGTIDKFIGDAIMAFWGAPIKTEDHATQATLAALEMQQALQAVNLWLHGKGFAPLDIGVGIHTGPAVLGNIGSEHKLDYTIIGDSVNLASRIEGLTKHYQSRLLITESTRSRLPDTLPCRLLDLVRVKGKHRPIRIYQPLGVADDEEERHRLRAIEQTARHAFEAYLQRDWDEAIRAFERLPDDAASRLLLQRCRHYRQEDPGASWDGVCIMRSK